MDIATDPLISFFGHLPTILAFVVIVALLSFVILIGLAIIYGFTAPYISKLVDTYMEWLCDRFDS